MEIVDGVVNETGMTADEGATSFDGVARETSRIFLLVFLSSLALSATTDEHRTSKLGEALEQIAFKRFADVFKEAKVSFVVMIVVWRDDGEGKSYCPLLGRRENNDLVRRPSVSIDGATFAQNQAMDEVCNQARIITVVILSEIASEQAKGER